MVKWDKIYEKRAANIKLNVDMSIITKILKKCSMSSKQKNKTRELMCKAFEKKYSNAEIGL